MKCKYHFIDVTIAREKQIRTRDSKLLPGIPANTMMLHIYVLIDWVLVSLVLRIVLLLTVLGGTQNERERCMLLPVSLFLMFWYFGL